MFFFTFWCCFILLLLLLLTLVVVVVCVVGSEEIRQLKKELNEAQKHVQPREVPSSVTTRRVSNSRQLDESDDNDDVSSPVVIICHFKNIFVV